MAADPVNSGAGADPGHRVALKTLAQVRGEIGRIYRCAVTGRITPLDASRLVRTLEILSDVIERQDLEEKLKSLEAQIEEQKQLGSQAEVIALKKRTRN